ncbi:MAG: hypothetical protein HJJLKODD_01642 [Phycisphaerae bacterium]|nr:hypothetical protein [Phycisphaerae bacterium]
MARRIHWLTLSAVVQALPIQGLAQELDFSLESTQRQITGDSELYHPELGTLTVAVDNQVVLYDAERDKELALRVSYPVEAGSYPLIIFSHGKGGSKSMYQPLVKYWVSNGYVVIQPNHSDSIAIPVEERADEEEWYTRPEDCSFILDSLAEIYLQVPEVVGQIDESHIAVGGHSFGAHTSQLLGGVDPRGDDYYFVDARFQATLLISPQGLSGLMGRTSWDEYHTPMMVVTGTQDYGQEGQSWRWRLHPYLFSPEGDKYLAVIKGADHGFGGIVGLPNPNWPPNEDHVTYVRSASLAFWDTYLKDNAVAREYLVTDALEEATEGEVLFRHK